MPNVDEPRPRPEGTNWVRVCDLVELEREGTRVVHLEGHVAVVVFDRGAAYALDNRCPHLGFPLHRGTVRDGILTCHWHHAKFDLASGCTFDPFADDVPIFRVEIRHGAVWLDPKLVETDRTSHWLEKLEQGLEQNLSLVLAKSALGVTGSAATDEAIRKAALFGVNNRASGWSTGLSILTCMANVLPVLEREDRALALYHGLIHVADSTANQPASFDLAPLNDTEPRSERYLDWFRRFIDLRASDAAERTLRTALQAGQPRDRIAEMIFAACTDHLFLDGGHSLDFANKAFELLDHVGWEHAPDVLTSLIPNLAGARRAEESASWRHPVDLPALLTSAHRELAALMDDARDICNDWNGHAELAAQIVDGEPDETISALLELLRSGVPLEELSSAVAYASALRPVYFRVTNEFGDWDTVHHTFTYANAVDQALRRAPSKLLARGIFDGAMSVYLERFLNVPKQSIPQASGAAPTREQLLECFDEYGHVDATAQLVANALGAGLHDEVIAVLGHALLREDADFHEFQIFEAGVRQFRLFAGQPAGDHILIGVARFLSAHAPTVRATTQTFETAARLQRGEALHGDEA